MSIAPHLLPLLAVVLACMAHPAVSAEPKPKKANSAVTDLSAVDEDFAVQGEYQGAVHIPDSQVTYGGLQVIARGEGKFDAVFYPGGLPGSGWTGKDRTTLTGGRMEKSVRMSGMGWNLDVAGNAASLTATSSIGGGVLTKTFRQSPTEGLPCPIYGTPLYDVNWKMGFKNARKTPDRLLMVGTETKYPLRDFRMHVEFRLPYMPQARGQGRSNSGVYLQSRYEVQILDSFGLEGKNNECGSLYTYQPPLVNMCYPPLRWQTYDIDFRSPRFDKEGKKVVNGRLTVWHNGVKVQDHFSIERKTGAGQPEGPSLLPTKLQDHGNPVHFRNIWVVDYDQAVPEWRNPTLPAPPVGAYNAMSR